MNVETDNNSSPDVFQETRIYQNDREAEKLAVQGIPPKGFMTGDEFERRVKEKLKQLYKEHGLL
jgi:hypothetical protein